jgi:hypothetical protein
MEHVGGTGKIKGTFQSNNDERRDPLRKLGVVGRIILS